MAQTEAYTAARLIEERRLGDQAVGIPTYGDQSTADEIDEIYEAEFRRRLAVVVEDSRKELEARVAEAKAEAMDSAVEAFNREAIGFQASWGSNPEDVMKLDVIGKALDWMKARAEKYRDQLPRVINVKETYKSLSDGAKIEYRGTTFWLSRGHGEFRSDYGDRITARLFDEEAKLVDHNL